MVLASSAGGQGAPYGLNFASVGSAKELLAAIVNVVAPVDGTQDAEASRTSTYEALRDLLTRYPEADLANLNDGEREFVVERFVALDVYARFKLDLENAVVANAPDPRSALQRLAEIRGYITSNVAASFARTRATGDKSSASNTYKIAQRALLDAFKVFEGYAE